MQNEFFKISQRISTVKISFNGNLQEGFDLLEGVDQCCLQESDFRMVISQLIE